MQRQIGPSLHTLIYCAYTKVINVGRFVLLPLHKLEENFTCCHLYLNELLTFQLSQEMLETTESSLPAADHEQFLSKEEGI